MLEWGDVTYSRLPERGVRPRKVAAARGAQSPGDRRAPVGFVRGAEVAGVAGAHRGCRSRVVSSRWRLEVNIAISIATANCLGYKSRDSRLQHLNTAQTDACIKG